MPLSEKEKEALAEHYKGKDLYDPTQAKEQEVSDFSPKCMCGGHVMGMCNGGMSYAEGGMAGYADGGEIDLGDQGFQPSDFSGPALSADTDTVKSSTMTAPTNTPTPDWTGSAGFTGRPPIASNGSTLPQVQPSVSPAPEAIPAPMAAQATPGAGRLSTDQFDQLIQGLQKKSIGQSAMSGLAGLADAIETGVARSGNPGFQKNIEESRQNQRQDLINALRQKYESGFKGQELAETQRQHNLEDVAKGEERKVQREGQKLASGQHAAQLAQVGSEKALENARDIIKQDQEASTIMGRMSGKTRPLPQAVANAQKLLAGGAGPAAQEVERNFKGKPAIFNANTKQFIRWK